MCTVGSLQTLVHFYSYSVAKSLRNQPVTNTTLVYNTEHAQMFPQNHDKNCMYT